MNKDQVKEMIENVLNRMGKSSPEAIDLLMLTAAQESHLGEYVKQLGGGPALGIFQMEPATAKDIFDNYLEYRSDLKAMVLQYVSNNPLYVLNIDLWMNIGFQISMARVHYLRVKEAIPKPGDFKTNYDYVYALAVYWKNHWNTKSGAGTVPEAVDNYFRYVGV